MDNIEYEIQHFRFSAIQVSLERKHFLGQIVSIALKKMVHKLTSSTETQAVLLQQEKEAGRRIMNSFEERLEAASALDRKNFSIPSYVLLAPDFEQAKQYTESEERRIDEQLAELKQIFLENSIMIAMLKMENEQYVSLEPYIQDELKVHTEILKSYKAADMNKWRILVDETKDIVRL